MLRVQYRRYGGPEELKLDNVKQAANPRQNQIRVRVMAASVNPMDWKIRAGVIKMITGSQFPRGIGTDFAGIIESIGPEVTKFKVGDEIFGAVSVRDAGSFAEIVITTEKNAVIKPPSVSFEDAATLPIAGATAWTALVDKAHLKDGQSVFINGCMGGVGRAAIQIAHMLGAKVAGSCSAEVIDEAYTLGATTIVDYRRLDISQLRNQFAVVFDTAGSLSPRQCSEMLQPGGVALHIVPTPLKMIVSFVSAQHKVIFGDTAPEILTKLADAAAKGQLTVSIGRRVPLSQAIPAITELEKTGLPKGKLIITPV